MKTQWTMIYWQSDTCWLGKLLEHPEIITLGETLEELEENLKEAHLLRILADVPDGYQTKTIRCEIPTRKTLSIPGVGDQVRPGEMTLNEAERASQEGLTMQNSGADTVYTALRKLDGVDDQLLDRPEIAHLASILEGDETPECVATNGQLSITVATDRRVIDIEQAIWSNSIKKVESYLYADIRRIEAGRGWSAPSLEIETSEGTHSLTVDKKTRFAFAEFVAGKIRPAAVEGTGDAPKSVVRDSRLPEEDEPRDPGLPAISAQPSKPDLSLDITLLQQELTENERQIFRREFYPGEKSSFVMLLCAVFGGFIGCHRMYVGKPFILRFVFFWTLIPGIISSIEFLTGTTEKWVQAYNRELAETIIAKIKTLRPNTGDNEIKNIEISSSSGKAIEAIKP